MASSFSISRALDTAFCSLFRSFFNWRFSRSFFVVVFAEDDESFDDEASLEEESSDAPAEKVDSELPALLESSFVDVDVVSSEEDESFGLSFFDFLRDLRDFWVLRDFFVGTDDCDDWSDDDGDDGGGSSLLEAFRLLEAFDFLDFWDRWAWSCANLWLMIRYTKGGSVVSI